MTIVEQELFSEEEMRGGIDIMNLLVDGYLEAMRIISCLDDEQFFALSHEYQPPVTGQESYFLRALPTRFFTPIQYFALGDCINMRHAHDDYPNPFQEQNIPFLDCFEEARVRFMDENQNGAYKYANWIRSYGR